MQESPKLGTDAALRATFRLVIKDSEPASAIGKLIVLEPFNFPGASVMHHGKGENLGVGDSLTAENRSSVFRLVDGLDGKDGTVSLESESERGCFVYSEAVSGYGGEGVKLNCSSGSLDGGYRRAVSFRLRDGISKYHPLSFVANGVGRNFVLAPLLSLRDESYTIYFNVST